MPRLTPTIEVRPLGGLFWYGLLAAVVIGVVFASSLGGALVWIAFWLVALAIAYFALSKVWGSLT